MKNISLIFLLFLLAGIFCSCQKKDVQYQVYAIKFTDCGSGPAASMIVGADSTDSIHVVNIFWLLKSDDGKNILVDAGYIDTSENAVKEKFTRPDIMLQELDLKPEDISDIIITHPHFDHIGGITLFPGANIWMQKKDYDYFVTDAWKEGGNHMGFDEEDVKNIKKVNELGKLKLVDGDSIEIMPGIMAFTGSKHTFENQYLLVNSDSNKVLLASDAIWFYLNIYQLRPAILSHDPEGYVNAMRRMKTLVNDTNYIIPGHDDLLFSMFPKVSERIVKIGH